MGNSPSTWYQIKQISVSRVLISGNKAIEKAGAALKKFICVNTKGNYLLASVHIHGRWPCTSTFLEIFRRQAADIVSEIQVLIWILLRATFYFKHFTVFCQKQVNSPKRQKNPLQKLERSEPRPCVNADTFAPPRPACVLLFSQN